MLDGIRNYCKQGGINAIFAEKRNDMNMNVWKEFCKNVWNWLVKKPQVTGIKKPQVEKVSKG